MSSYEDYSDTAVSYDVTRIASGHEVILGMLCAMPGALHECVTSAKARVEFASIADDHLGRDIVNGRIADPQDPCARHRKD